MHYKSNVQLKRELDEIEFEIHELKKQLIDPEPERFSKTDVVRSFFGALIFGFSFLFSGGLISVVRVIHPFNITMIALSTIVILNAEIYFIGYSRVKNKRDRPYWEFMLKRMVSFYAIALVVSFYLSVIYGLIYFMADLGSLMNLAMVMAMPCSIGAAVSDLLKKY